MLKKLWNTKLLRPRGLWHLGWALASEGSNLLALLRYSAKMYPGRIALQDEQQQLSYASWYQQSKQLAARLQAIHQLKKGDKVVLLGPSEIPFLITMMALARTPADLFLLNPELSLPQLKAQLDRLQAKIIVCTSSLQQPLQDSNIQAITFEEVRALKVNTVPRLKRKKGGQLVVLTGGTSGQFKTAARKPKIGNFLAPFFALLRHAQLDRYRRLWVGTPIYHGFGLAAVIMACALGAEMQIAARFDSLDALKRILEREVEVLTLVPLMLARLLAADAQALQGVKCLLCGGAALSPQLAQQVQKELPGQLFSLYGTSEAGFSVMAGPEALAQAPATIGKPIRGVDLQLEYLALRHLGGEAIGEICIRSKWTMLRKKEEWIRTGDLATQNEQGFLFLKGRRDEMIVSGGENVFPKEVEDVLRQHPAVQEVAVLGIEDAEFGQRLGAFITISRAIELKELETWSKTQLARFQQPKWIRIIDTMPLTAIGKVDKKKLLLNSE